MKTLTMESKKSKQVTILLQKGLSIKEKEIKGKVTFYEKEMVHSLLYKKFNKKYQNLIRHLCFYLSTDDESGTVLSEALNEIEKFRLELKNKYRKMLKKKEVTRIENEMIVFEEELIKKFYVLSQLRQNQKETIQNRSR